MSATDPSQASRPQDLFSDLFVQVFGLDNATQLIPEYPVQDIYGVSRFIDFALRTLDDKVAIEIDGGAFHDPLLRRPSRAQRLQRRRLRARRRRQLARVRPRGVCLPHLRSVMLEMPFKKFEQRRCLKYDRDLAFVRFAPALWRQLQPADRAALRRLCEQSIEAYYARLP